MIRLPGKIFRQANQSAMVRRFRQGLQRLARLLEILMNDFNDSARVLCRRSSSTTDGSKRGSQFVIISCIRAFSAAPPLARI